MKIISENDIDTFVDLLDENGNIFDDVEEYIENQQPAILALLSDDELKVLSDDEYELLWFVVTVIVGTVKQKYPGLIQISPKVIESFEENNWTVWNANQKKKFSDILDVYFKNYKQEDLLAFLEDSLEPDEEFPISSTGREIVFIISKTIIDSLDDALE